jgi:hypothetical protein
MYIGSTFPLYSHSVKLYFYLTFVRKFVDPFYSLENMVRYDITMKGKLVPVTKIYGVEKRKIVERREIKAAKLTNEEKAKEISTGSSIKC